MRLYKQVTLAKQFLLTLNRRYRTLLLDPPAEGVYIKMPYTDELDMLVFDLSRATLDPALRRTAVKVAELHHQLNAMLDEEYIIRENIYIGGKIVENSIKNFK